MPENNQNIEYIKLNGGTPLNGEITVKGFKNSMPKDMIAALLTSEKCILRNISQIRDIEIMSDMIKDMGGNVQKLENDVIEINCRDLHSVNYEVLEKYTGISRIPTLATGPLLSRFGEAIMVIPGGCNIGERPINFHIEALKQMGASVEEIECGYSLKANKLKGAKIRLEYPSVGATEQILFSAVLAEGVTELSNAAIEPDIMDLILVLQKMGAYISVDTDRVITVTGVEKLHGFDHTSMPDRNEVVSWACAAVATNGRIFVKGARQIDVMTFLNKFRQVGGCFEVKNDGIIFYKGENLSPVALETDVHPGFMTDWQQPFVLILTQAEGASVIHETVYENRFGYTEALNNMGAQIQIFKECLGGKYCRFGRMNHKHSAIIVGKTPLHSAEIEIPDLRAGFTYVIAALVAEGETKLNNISIINRGYENIFGKLQSLGVNVKFD